MFVTLTSADIAGEPIPDAVSRAILSIAGVTIEEVVDYELSFARLGPGLISAGSIESAA